MPELQQLEARHAPAVLDFERANRAYFASFIADRGDAYFEHFDEGFSALLTEQDAGISLFHVLIAEDGSVLGRFNLFDVEGGSAELGYRVARHAAGRGLATATVRELCGFAATRHHLRTLIAGTSPRNLASQKVLTNTGFTPTTPPPGRETSVWFRRDLRERA
ncbi:GNAT family N-acetyltransferase [Actinacidiphila acidipaludis]|uniref:GNAT family N-acetyltransferase n=1 Tax=Actinacidiphila acidipaludis TaxID=2873382 RepID=A0ABS7Q1L7_9ACTN|nr:GNAT family N-acetyltransferase [Streptomyces acidipaludis]MBY8877031.1 GNAT family N-acetyltransferase [Streptomyces acidipaludis]